MKKNVKKSNQGNAFANFQNVSVSKREMKEVKGGSIVVEELIDV